MEPLVLITCLKVWCGIGTFACLVCELRNTFTRGSFGALYNAGFPLGYIWAAMYGAFLGPFMFFIVAIDW